VLKNYFLPLLLSATVLLSSCEKEENVPQPDYSIGSTSRFELLDQHQNGWIKQGRYQLSGDPTEEFEYYENGYIKSAKVYASYPQQHLYMEVSRSEDNKPLWSKYYHPDGTLWFETEYKNGLPSVKKVYCEAGTAIHTYSNGELSTVEFTAADGSSTATTTYNKAAETRNVIITRNGETVLNENYAYREQVGAGIYTNTHVPIANPFGAIENSYYKLNQSYSQTPAWENDADPISFMLPYRLFDEFYNPANYFATRFAVSTELYQSVIEQYPVTERGVLIGGGKYEDGYEAFSNQWEVRDSLAKVYEEDPELYKLKYGNEYVEKVGYGKVFFIIGAIRNLPTDSNLADDIKNIARKRMEAMINGSTGITREEEEKLDKVWFEVKFFSTLKEHRGGVVINSFADYKNAIEQMVDRESSVIQLQYKSVENL
jgi:antitoxin component YwqK of YwqJK toxin-antitoxin module